MNWPKHLEHEPLPISIEYLATLARMSFRIGLHNGIDLAQLLIRDTTIPEDTMDRIYKAAVEDHVINMAHEAFKEKQMTKGKQNNIRRYKKAMGRDRLAAKKKKAGKGKK